MISLEEQTGFKRIWPLSLCQNWDILSKISIFTYDLNDSEFISYLKSRGIVHLGSDKELFEANSEPKEQWISMLKQKIEDAWDIYTKNQEERMGFVLHTTEN